MLNEQSNERVLFSGYAKLPVGITAAEMYKVIGVIVVVDMKSGLIVKADCTLATELARAIYCAVPYWLQPFQWARRAAEYFRTSISGQC